MSLAAGLGYLTVVVQRMSEAEAGGVKAGVDKTHVPVLRDLPQKLTDSAPRDCMIMIRMSRSLFLGLTNATTATDSSSNPGYIHETRRSAQHIHAP